MRQSIAGDSPNRQYVSLETAFAFFNRRLFDGELPSVFISLQRRSGSDAHYVASRFEGRTNADRRTDELTLNPVNFSDRTDVDILSTLVHEMVHHWQQHFGKPGRGPYHNREWAAKMDSVGLVPSDTGLPGGKRTGDSMSHYILASAAFQIAPAELLAAGVRLEWQARNERSGTNKTKYTCPSCGLRAWGKPAIHLVCGNCNKAMVSKRR